MTLSLYLKNYLHVIGMRFASRMSYRGDFVASMLGSFLYQLTIPGFLGILYAADMFFPGWSFAQLLVLSGVLALIKGFGFLLVFGMMGNTIRTVQNGSFDLLLTKPQPVLWQLLVRSFDEEDIAQVFAGVLILGVGIYYVGGVAGNIPLFLLLSLLGFVFFCSMVLLFCAASLRFVNTWGLYEFLGLCIIYAGYPKSIHQKSVQIAITYIVPLALLAHYPASALLGFPLEGVVGSSIAVLVLAVCSYGIWTLALRRYTSAGG